MPVHAQFEHIFKELGRKNKCTFKENFTFLWKLWWNQ
jgi:hypothetical protein